MTEKQLTQARADLALLDIEQLRCGVMLQLLKIDDLTQERDEYQQAADTQAAAHKVERDELSLQLDVQAGSIEAVQAANKRMAAERDAALEQNTELDARCAKLESDAPYDQQAMELCHACGWKAIMPGEQCFVCNMQTDAQQVAVPPGYALVPIEPTEEMMEAGPNAELFAPSKRSAYRVYKAMLAAAPQGGKQ